jgi:hypothetical protein
VSADAALIPCVGCGALVPASDGPTHRYVGASPGCWQHFGELGALELDTYHAPAVRQLVVDAYMVQHPGVPGRQSSQSVAVHLMSLCLEVERAMPPARATRTIGRFAHAAYPWLEPPASMGALTVLNMRGAGDVLEYVARAERWARSAWSAWYAHHVTVHGWLEERGYGTSGAPGTETARPRMP